MLYFLYQMQEKYKQKEDDLMTELTKITWKDNNGKWLAYDPNGNQITGWLHDLTRDTWYFCYSNDIAKGWMKDNDGRWYYFFKDQCVDYNSQMYKGEMKTGWLEDDGKWYYLVPKSIPSNAIYRGQMLYSTTETIDDAAYTFDDSGAWVENTSSNNGLSDEGAEFISSWEGYTSTWEDVGDGYLTIGIGLATSSTLGKEVYASGVRSCPKEQAYEWLQEECQSCYEVIKSKLSDNNIILTQNKIDALISFSYNCGIGALLGSTLFKNILNGVTDATTIKSNFEAWSYCNGVVWEGLKKRRTSEANLYLNADYIGNV